MITNFEEHTSELTAEELALLFRQLSKDSNATRRKILFIQQNLYGGLMQTQRQPTN